MRSEIDLTPFGFTATESHVYAVLLQLGPSTGYGVAHAARVARANTYGALEGLVRRTAAARLPGRPARFRAPPRPHCTARRSAGRVPRPPEPLPAQCERAGRAGNAHRDGCPRCGEPHHAARCPGGAAGRGSGGPGPVPAHVTRVAARA